MRSFFYLIELDDVTAYPNVDYLFIAISEYKMDNIRKERSPNNIRLYIINNPLSWHQDQLHFDNPSKW
ncbi:hypothetical protein [Myxosarcina sp. GI1]|uniref:hypothetical protein n=1 Tax=Myxosarcina sp. GI1 TaxID=1541065 RepID=UPI001C10E4FF|nr:hypothetical protein [Myxosarcina sp. GI1]